MTPTVRWAALLLLAGCSSGGNDAPQQLSPPPPAIADPLAYLVQSVNPDGNTATPLHAADPMTYRRQDYGAYQMSESFLAPDGSAITTWNYPPFGPLATSDRNGGEHYVLDGEWVRADSTQDPGTPGIQYFVGSGCGGTGWLLFKTDATADWQEAIADLSMAHTPDACATGSRSLTRYIHQAIAYPKLGTIDSIVSEHYDHPTLATSVAMERFFFGHGWGRLVWQAFGTSAPTVDLTERCPDFGWNTPPAPGWYLTDCRVVVTLIAPPIPLSGADEWHP